MCGRYTLSTPIDVVRDLFDLTEAPELRPRFNIAPTQEAPVVRVQAGARGLDLVKWGLVPYWAKDPSSGPINARSETVAEKPSFRAAFKKRRCLVVADGFYEWQKVAGSGKQPFYFQLPDSRPFAFAGLWERWAKGDEPLETFTILTKEANQIVGEIHPRMPVILGREAYAPWLDPELQDGGMLSGLLEIGPMDELTRYPVSTYVNSPANDSPECIVSLGAP